MQEVIWIKRGKGIKAKPNVNAHSDPAVSMRECERSVMPLLKESSHKSFCWMSKTRKKRPQKRKKNDEILSK